MKTNEVETKAAIEQEKTKLAWILPNVSRLDRRSSEFTT